MIRFLYILIITLLTFESVYASNNPVSSKKYIVAFAQDTLSNDWRLAQVKQLEEAFKKHPSIEFIYTDGEGDTTKQIQDIENLMHQNIDLLITSPRNGLIMTPVISEAYKKVPVVLITRRITTNEFTAIVSPNDYNIASKAAHAMARALNNKGKVLMLRGIVTSTTAINREKGFTDTIKKHYPKITISSIKNGNYLRVDAIKAVDEVLLEGISFDAVYAHSDSMASGARMSLKHANIDVKSKVIIGIDYISEAKSAIKNNEQYASFLYTTCAKETADVVVKILNNKKYKRETVVDSVLITKDNVNEVSPIF